eukprot:1133221-Pelagomonas_calceolata.AAC.6
MFCVDWTGMLYAGSLWLSNSAYLYLSVSFIQMTKSLMPGLVFASGVFLGTEKFSRLQLVDLKVMAALELGVADLDLLAFSWQAFLHSMLQHVHECATMQQLVNFCAEVVGGLENKGEEKVQQQEGSSRRGPAERGTDVRERVPACLSELEASTAESARRSEDADYFFKL